MFRIFVSVDELDKPDGRPWVIYDTLSEEAILATDVQIYGFVTTNKSKLHTFHGKYSARAWLETKEEVTYYAEGASRTVRPVPSHQ